jgi:hypothetical protein
MFLIGHSAVALAVTAWTDNPALAMAIGFASHFAVDAVPHGDEDFGRFAKRSGHEVRWFALAMVADLVLIAGAYAWLLSRIGFSWEPLFAIAGACAPDFMWGFERLLGRKVFGPVSGWHHTVHNFLKVEMPLWLGLILQAAVSLALWRWLGR